MHKPLEMETIPESSNPDDGDTDDLIKQDKPAQISGQVKDYSKMLAEMQAFEDDIGTFADQFKSDPKDDGESPGKKAEETKEEVDQEDNESQNDMFDDLDK